jgi:hypothetical protein
VTSRSRSAVALSFVISSVLKNLLTTLENPASLPPIVIDTNLVSAVTAETWLLRT